MARSISVTTPSTMTDSLLSDVSTVDELLELKVFRGASVQPPGDIVSFTVPNRRLNHVMRLLDKYELGEKNGVSVATSDVEGYVPTGPSQPIERDNNEATWEEMEMTISNDSNSSPNTLLTMFIAGSLATIGLAGNTLHIVIAGMLLAPGFMPILRVALVLVGRRKAARWGLEDFCKNYLALITGAGVSAAVLVILGHDPLAPQSSYYESTQSLVSYWTSVTPTSILASVGAALAGTLLVATKRSVFTSGVMVGLALVPTAALIGVGLVKIDFSIVVQAALRFILDVAIIFCVGWLALLWDKQYLHKRNIKL